jgi:hypothetical protein
MARILIPAFLYGVLSCCCSGNEERASKGNRRVAQVAKEDVTPRVQVEEPRQPTSLPVDMIENLVGKKIIGVRPISIRSLSLKVRMAQGGIAAFKPLLHDNGTARFEVAYYRLARLLRVEGVPPSTMCEIPLARLKGHLGKHFPDVASSLEKEARTGDNGAIPGAMITWMNDIVESGFDGRTGRKKLDLFLAIDGPALDEEPLVAPASSMIVLDYVAGNWDRFSGGNLFADSSGSSLVLIDNNGSFSSWSDRQRKRMGGLLLSCQRFSAALISRLRGLQSREVMDAMEWGPTRPGRALLKESEIALLLARRDELVAHVDELIAKHGEERILIFP